MTDAPSTPRGQVVPPSGTASGTAAEASPPSTVKSKEHCPYRQAGLLQEALTPSKMRVALLLGAGCPVSIRVGQGDAQGPLIPDVRGLTARVLAALEADADAKPLITSVMRRMSEDGAATPTIEEILSHIRALSEVIGKSTVDGLTRGGLERLDERICDRITSAMGVRLPPSRTPYHHLASWIGSIRRAHPVEVFTTNYDLLMEEAFEACRVPYFDGFVGTDRPFFDLGSMELETLPSRWARLWKIHGSINWWMREDGGVERHSDARDCKRKLIHPSNLKYAESRRMPYLAMLDRLRSFLLRGQGVLVTCGYSFQDQHINEVLAQGLSGNATAVCFGLLFGDRASEGRAAGLARDHANLRVLAVDGAILGTVDRPWTKAEKEDHPLHGACVTSGDLKSRTTAPTGQGKLLLGDFQALGEFLAQQLSHRNDREAGSSDAP